MAELAWPADLGHGTFTGRFGFMDADSHDPDREPDITSATGGTVTITPSIKSVRYTGAQGPMILAARPAKGVIDSEGYLCTATADGDAGDRGMVFPATDDTDLTPTDWTYEVSIILDGQVRIGTFNVKLPAGATVDLSLAVPVPSSGGTAVVVDPTTAERAEAAATRAETAAAEAEDYAPTFVWDGTALSIDGKPGVDLKGDPGTTAWADLTGTPDTFPSTVADVDGLQDIVDQLTYDSGWRDVSSLLPAGLAKAERNGRCNIKRRGDRFLMDMQLNVTAAGITAIMSLPAEWRPDVPVLVPVSLWTATAIDSALPPTQALGYFGAGGARLSARSALPNPGTVMLYLDLPITGPIPTTLPGTPA